MGSKSAPSWPFLEELRRRGVLRVAAVYAAVGWVVVEVSATTLPLLQLPDWTSTLVLVLVLLGFPLAVGLAWAFDLTSAGVRRTASAEEAHGVYRVDGPITQPRRKRVRRWIAPAAALALLMAGVALSYRALDDAPIEEGPRVMVLPFENRTGDASLDPVGQMVSEWISGSLGQMREVLVVPNMVLLDALAESRAGAPGGRAEPGLDRLAELTRAGIAVTGSYYRRPDALEFHTQVVDVDSREPLAVLDPVRGPLDDPVQGIDSVRTQVMGALGARLDSRVSWEMAASMRPSASWCGCSTPAGAVGSPETTAEVRRARSHPGSTP